MQTQKKQPPAKHLLENLLPTRFPLVVQALMKLALQEGQVQKKNSPPEKETNDTHEVDYEPLRYLELRVNGRKANGLLDSGCTHCIISEDLIDDIQQPTFELKVPVILTIGDGRQFDIQRGVKNLRCKAGDLVFLLNALVAPIPFQLILGLPFMTKQRLFTGFEPPVLTG